MQEELRKKIFLAAVFAFVLLLPIVAFAAPTSTVAPTQEALTAPKLNIKIPGLVFADYSEIQNCQNGLKCISVPFLAQYISAFFKILLGIGMVATALMIVWGGFLYVMGGTGLQVSDAKKKISDALIGMAILVGAYLILLNINPQTITLKGLDIPSVSRQEQDFLAMTSNNTTPTMGNPQIDFQPLPGEECPMIATAVNQSNKTKYFNGILATVRSGSYTERLKKVADIVTGCNVNLLDCGHTAMAIMALAGIGETDCLTDDKKLCWSFKEYSKNINGIYQTKNSMYLMGLHKNGNCGNISIPYGESDRLPQGQAIAKARQKMESWEENYPDSVADKFMPGDFIWTYTANNECDGLHSSLFVDWVNKSKGLAKMVEGDIKTNPRYTQRCFKKACGNYQPIIRIMRPKPERLRGGG